MNLTWSNSVHEISVSRAIEKSIEDKCSDSSGRGAIERVEAHTEATAAMVAEVIEILHRKGLLTDDELQSLFSYRVNVS